MGTPTQFEKDQAVIRLHDNAKDLLVTCRTLLLDLENGGELLKSDRARINMLEEAISKAEA